MKLTKTSIAIIFAGSLGIIALTAPIFADGNKNCQQGQSYMGMMNNHGPKNKNPEKMIERMSHKLDLSDQQREQAFTKLDEFKPQMKQAHLAIREGMQRIHEIDSDADNFTSNLDELATEQGKRVADMIKLRKTMHVEFEQILTDEQKEKFEKLKQKRGGRHHFEHKQS